MSGSTANEPTASSLASGNPLAIVIGFVSLRSTITVREKGGCCDRTVASAV
jgi:hypothetical protein